MRLKLLMSFVYFHDYSIEIFVVCTVEDQVSRDDERYLCTQGKGWTNGFKTRLFRCSEQ